MLQMKVKTKLKNECRKFAGRLIQKMSTTKILTPCIQKRRFLSALFKILTFVFEFKSNAFISIKIKEIKHNTLSESDLNYKNW